MGQMGRMEIQDGSASRPANGFMREAMPVVSAWIDELRTVFGREEVTQWVREGLADGTFHAAENGHELGDPADVVERLELQAAEPANAISLADMVIEAPELKAQRAKATR